MPIKQQEFYAQLRQETEQKIQTYSEFQEQIDKTKKHADDAITALKTDMKFLAKQIEANNQMLQLQGLDTVKFEK
ncbi:MAG: hypothetical protein PHQ86_04770 [Dehalococcoidales bacterium]|jgi:mevalonate kinase|nr:hypothetical protein [Dehalococcoidales bacterium]